VSDGYEHLPVLVDRVVELFAPVPPGTVVDATLGGGGHAAALLTAHPHLRVLGIDRDTEALEAAAVALAPFGDRVSFRHGRFDDLTTILREQGPHATTTERHDERPAAEPVTGVLFDLGVSSPQLDRAGRGFSYRVAGPLDMRMDRTQERTAADVVNGYSESELVRVFRDNGDERYAPRIAAAIARHRSVKPIETTTELADIVRDAIPAPARRRGGHPARRAFQAIRIEVNAELDILPAAIDDAIDVVEPGGRVVVISYHSGEDRIVKDRFRNAASGGCTCPPGLPCVCGAVPSVRLLRRGAEKPSAAEIEANRRAESARLRAVEKLATTGGSR
jgi:16S rRNA (cytosine1402-N4)-methyltransferase